MTQVTNSQILAILGPTNTGKTFLAIERMLEHGNGVIGFPLRLLAREVYDKIVNRIGPERVALVTGEEKLYLLNPIIIFVQLNQCPSILISNLLQLMKYKCVQIQSVDIFLLIVF